MLYELGADIDKQDKMVRTTAQPLRRGGECDTPIRTLPPPPHTVEENIVISSCPFNRHSYSTVPHQKFFVASNATS